MRTTLALIHPFVILLALMLGRTSVFAEAEPERATQQGFIRSVVERLSSEEFEGRRVGEDGGSRTFNYLYKELAKLGLIEPSPVGNVQAFDVARGIKVVGEPKLQIAGSELKLGTDYDIAPFSGSGSATSAPLVFAGYGIVAPDLGWNDYAELDVEGAIVVIVRGEPQAKDKDSKFSGDQPSTYADLRRKASTARDRGAAALLILNNPLTDEEDKLPEQQATYSTTNFDIPALHVKRAALDELISNGAGQDLKTLLEAMDRYGMPASSPLGEANASLDLQVDRDLVQGRNLIGVIPGTDPALAGQLVVIGAHYDHLGVGGTESLAPELYGQFHHGADDNASGVAAVLELARRLVKSPLKRTVLVCFFDAEEIGTVGSRHLVDALPMDRVYAMLNFDMVGRLRNSELVLGGTGTASEFAPILTAAQNTTWTANPEQKLTVKNDSGGFGASDHINFFQRRIPALFFFTGSHEDYHKPSDTPDKVNFDGIEQIVRFAHTILRMLDQRDKPLTFVEVAPQQAPQRSRGQLTVTLGTIPSYVENPELEGMAIGDVVKGGPAAMAGLRAGDVIIRIGEKKVGNIYDFMYALEGRNAGESVEVEVLRGEEPVTVQVTLASRGVEQ